MVEFWWYFEQFIVCTGIPNSLPSGTAGVPNSKTSIWR